LASSRETSNGPDLLDLTSALEAFEHLNGCKVTMRIYSEVKNEHWALWLEGQVWEQSLADPEAKLSVSERLRCSDTSWKSLDIAAFRLLYALDAALAFKEMGGKRPIEHSSRHT
jgi:hypothetical protein